MKSGPMKNNPMKSISKINLRSSFIPWVTFIATALGWMGAAHSQDSSLLHVPSPRVAISPPRPINPSQMDPLAMAPAVHPGAVHPGATGARAAGSPAYPVVNAGGNQERPPIFLNGVSWTHQPAPPIRSFHKNDVVTIRVDEITRVMAEGAAESRKRTLYEAALSDWIKLTDFRLRPDPQTAGDPTVGTESNNNFRAQSSVESRESVTFNITAIVVDIRPNGLLVLEARKGIRVNDNLWETSLTGICRVQDIGPDNVVLSKNLIDLEIRKDDRGHLRDGYKRGWFQRWFDRVQPF